MVGMIANISDRKDTKYFDSSKHYKEKPPDSHGDRYCFKNQTFKQENGLY
jgi:hypothetical protein